MGDVLGEMTGMEPEDLIPSDQPQLYVASTKENYHGAACIFYPGFLERTKKVIGDQFFIIPSSVHILQNFRMFSEEPAEVVPECENEVMCSIIDRFGYEVRA